MAINVDEIYYEGEWIRLTTIFENGEWCLDPDVYKLNAPHMSRAQIAGFISVLQNFLIESEGLAAPE